MPATQQLHNGTFHKQKEIANKNFTWSFFYLISQMQNIFFITEYSRYSNNILWCGYGSS